MSFSLISRIDDFMREAERQQQLTIRETLERMRDATLSPPGAGGAPHLTGNLRRSVAIGYDDGEIHTECGYGGFVHEGTVKQQANPFFTRAFETAKQEMNR